MLHYFYWPLKYLCKPNRHFSVQKPIYKSRILGLLLSINPKVLFTKIVIFAVSVDQDQAAQNMQPDLRSTLSTMFKHYRQQMAGNLLSSLSYCRIKIFIGFIRCFNPFPHNDAFWRLWETSLWKTLRKKEKLLKRVENTVGKGENALYKQFLLFPQCFLPVWKTFCHFRQTWNCRLVIGYGLSVSAMLTQKCNDKPSLQSYLDLHLP